MARPNATLRIRSHRQRIDSALRRVGAITDPETQADLAKYVCVVVCGYLERSVVDLALEHVRSRSAPTVQAFAEARLVRTQNLSREQLLQFVSQFDGSWRESLEAFLSDEEVSSALTSVVSNRHRIAHGENVGVTFIQVKEWTDRIQKILDHLEGVMLSAGA